MFALRGYQAYGNASWIDNVEQIIVANLATEDDMCGGGVKWLTYNHVEKNTITNTYVRVDFCSARTMRAIDRVLTFFSFLFFSCAALR